MTATPTTTTTRPAASIAEARSIVIISALQDEALPTVGRLGLDGSGAHHSGEFNGRRIVATVTGTGGERTVNAMKKLLTGARPDWVLNIGLCGGLDPRLLVADVLDIKRVLRDGSPAFHIASGPPVANAPATPGAAAGDAPHPALLTQPQIADTPDRKRQLFERFDAAAVDMESYYVAKFCAGHGLPLTVLRAISDPADTTLPSVSLDWVNDDGSIDTVAAMRYLAFRPRLLSTFMVLGANSRKASRTLADRVMELLT